VRHFGDMYKHILWLLAWFQLTGCSCSSTQNSTFQNVFLEEFWENYYGDKYRHFSEAWRLETKSAART